MATGSAPDGNAMLVPKENCRPRHGRRRLHRLRRVRGHVPQRFGLAVPGAPRSRTWACCRRASRSATAAPSPWWRKRGQELFGSCTNIGECEAVCPKEIKLEVIARMNRDFLRANWTGRGDALRDDEAEVAGSKPLAGAHQ